jgi:extradiol dioxygenase family protein
VAAPILHLSLPVHDLDAARSFYVDVLGCEPGRVRDGWIDVWFYGLQLTLQEHPEQVPPAEQRGVRHFGVTLDAEQLAKVLTRLTSQPTDHPVTWLREASVEHAGTVREQTKAMIADPSGNAIELKAYADPAVAFAGPDAEG